MLETSPKVSSERLFAKIVEEVGARIKSIEKEGKIHIKKFSDEDRSLIRNAIIFDFFYQFLERFDQLILDQIKAGDIPLKVPFAREAISLLQERGFSLEDSCHYIALCYQLRRAFFLRHRDPSPALR